MNYLIIECLILFNIGVSSQSTLIFNNMMDKIEKIINITLPYREYSGQSFYSAAHYQEADLEVIMENIK